MSFWKGLSRAMESNQQQRNLEQQRADRLAADKKADERFNMQWKNTIAQQDRANERTDRLDARDEERYQVDQGRLDARDEAGRAAAKAAAEKATKEWKHKMAQWDYTKSRDVVADLRVARNEHTAAVQQIFDNDLALHGVEIANANRARNDAKFENTVKRQGVTDDQWNQSMQFKVSEADRAQGNVDRDFSRMTQRDAVADAAAAIALEVAAQEREYGKKEDAADRDQWQQSMDLRMDQFKNTLAQQGLSQENWERSFERQGEQQTLAQGNVMFGRKIKLLELSADMTKAFGGQGGSVKGSKVPASVDMSHAVLNIKSELGGKQGVDALPPESREFFDHLLGDPAAAYGVYAFVQSQRKEGNKLSITDLPKYVNLAGMVEAQGDSGAAARIREEILSSDPNINNLDGLVKGMAEAAKYKPASLVWGILETPKDSSGHSADLKLFNDALYSRAASTFAKMEPSDPQFELYKEAIHNMNSPVEITKAKGSSQLFDILGSQLAVDMGMQDNPALSLQLKEAQAAAAAKAQEDEIFSKGMQDISTLDTGMNSSGPIMGEEAMGSGMPSRVQEFTMAEAEAFMAENPDFRGKIRVDGELLSNEERPGVEGTMDSEVRREPVVALGEPSLDTVPVEVKEAVESIIATGNEADIKQAAAEIAAEYGEGMVGILFDGAKSARGTGKSAMMDGLQTPSRPAEPKEEGYVPPSTGATELNTPAVRAAIAKVPAEVKEAIESVVAQGDEAEVEQAKQEIADEFGEEVAESLFWAALKKRPGNRTQDIPGFGN